MAFFLNPLRNTQSPRPPRIKKGSFYVWFLGALEAPGLRGSDVVLPITRHLVKTCHRQPPSKMTLQISEKGIKIVQLVPTITKSAKIKMELLKFVVPYYSITYAVAAPPPLDDIVSVVMLIFNPETRCPVHVHAYRCDSPETARRMATILQTLVDRPDNRKRFADLEWRLQARGLLPRTQKLRSNPIARAAVADSSPQDSMISEEFNFLNHELSSEDEDCCTEGMDSSRRREVDFFRHHEDKRLAQMHKAVYNELKEKLDAKEKCPILYPPKDYAATLRRSRNTRQGPPLLDRANGSMSFLHLASVVTPPAKFHDSNRSSSTSGLGSGSDGTTGSGERLPTDHMMIPKYTRLPHEGSQERKRHSNFDDRFSTPSPDYPSQALPVFPVNQRHSIAIFDSSDFLTSSTPMAQSKMCSKSSTTQQKQQPHSPAVSQPTSVYRRFGDTIKFQAKVADKKSEPDRNWIVREKPPTPSTQPQSNFAKTRFTSVENLASARAFGATPTAGNRYEKPSSQNMREHRLYERIPESDGPTRSSSMWHLPSMVDPFGKKYEQTQFCASGRLTSQWQSPMGVSRQQSSQIHRNPR